MTNASAQASEQEDKIYVKGEIGFMNDDPGRQAVGSFNPITDTDWTEMAYVGNTARLCAAIVNGDLEDVRNWLTQDDADVNQRDHTGRTPLQLAVSCSTLEVVRALISAGARLVARMANGHTALHLAAERGHVPIIEAIMERSERNEAEHEEVKSAKKEERKQIREAKLLSSGNDHEDGCGTSKESKWYRGSSNSDFRVLIRSAVCFKTTKTWGKTTQKMMIGASIKIQLPWPPDPSLRSKMAVLTRLRHFQRMMVNLTFTTWTS